MRESQRRRYKSVELVDQCIERDTEWRTARFELDKLNAEFNKANKAVALKMKSGEKEEAEKLMPEVKRVDQARQDTVELEKRLEIETTELLQKIGNIVHDSVPVNNDEEFNTVHNTWGERRMEEDLPNHVDLVGMLDIADLEKGADVAGGRGYFLKGAGVLLNQAMINYALSFLASRGHTPLATPFFMRKERMAECAQLADFDEQLYKVTGEGDDKYLIATSEQTCCSYLRKLWLNEKDLPIRLSGYSTCFRKEVGSHGRDTLGIFRVHQFEKVEQFVAVTPEGNASWEEMDRLIGNAEAFYQSLNIPYNVVNIVSGELNDAAAKKFDLEAWFPSSRTHRELVSCSNCTDYQSRRLDIRYGAPQKGPEKTKTFVHLLNSTLTATERTLCCLIENWQTPDGMIVPPALRPWMCGIEFIPFVNKLDNKKRLVAVSPAPAPLFASSNDAASAGPISVFVNAGECAGSIALESILKKFPESVALKKSIAVDMTEEQKALFADPENVEGPAMIEGGDFVLTSATSIARYLAKTTQASSLAMLPTSAKENAKCESLVELFHHTNIEEVLFRVEKALESGDYVCGSLFTIADALLAAKLKTAKASVSAKAQKWLDSSL